MIKRRMRVLVLACFCVFLIKNMVAKPAVVSVSSRFPWYITLETGVNWRGNAPIGNGFKTFLASPVAGAAVGYQLNKKFRVEGEVVFRQTALGIITDTQPGPLTAEESSVAVMFNGYFTPVVVHHFVPFLGLGVGYGVTIYSLHVNLSPPPSFRHDRYESGNIAYQLLAGVNYVLRKGLRLGLAYKYFVIPRICYQSLKSSYKANEVLLRLTFLFNGHRAHLFGAGIPRHMNVAHRLYLAAEGGLSFREPQTYGTGVKSFHVGPAGGFVLGYHVSQHVSFEGEFMMRQNEVHSVMLGRAGSTNRPSGDETMLVFLMNVLLSPVTLNGFTPYVGAGIGYAYNSYAIHNNLSPNTPSVPPTFPSFRHPRRSDSEFAYQFIAGISHPITPHVVMGLAYHYFKMKMHYVSLSAPAIKTHLASHTILMRLSYLFAS